MNRRTFLGGLAAMGLQSSVLGLGAAPLNNLVSPKRQKRPSGRFDENLVILISDMHVLPNGHTPQYLSRVVDEILAMKPLPANVIGLGDLANLYGHLEDYECARGILKPLEDAGIKITLGMGNHDRRGNFAQVFPEKAAQTRLSGRLVFVVETPRADFIVLDSLQEDPDLGKWITPGAINDEQAQWLRDTLKGYSKPVFVSSHHSLGETKVLPILRECPSCCGYIYGHEHRWRTDSPVFQWGQRDLMRTLCLPSTGYWGDIGYTELHLGEDRAVATLHQSEYFFNFPLKEGEERPLQWTLNAQDNDGSHCSFSYIRPGH
ncbi:MAG: metallophosphoesterase [Bacteroidaceae bacterium]|nr:metallophosphoesterase [Bacteroidaceae bacterium]